MLSFDFPSVNTQAMLGTPDRALTANRASLAFKRAFPVFVPSFGYLIPSTSAITSARV